MNRLVFFGLVTTLLVAGCSKGSPTGPSQVNVPFSTVDVRVGTGTEATAGRTVSVNYTGWLYNAQGVDNKGQQFDSSIGRSPLNLVAGTGQIVGTNNTVIPGFTQGITGMRVGGLRRVTIPPSLAYGSNPPSGIPVNATLIFEIELLSVS